MGLHRRQGAGSQAGRPGASLRAWEGMVWSCVVDADTWDMLTHTTNASMALSASYTYTLPQHSLSGRAQVQARTQGPWGLLVKGRGWS